MRFSCPSTYASCRSACSGRGSLGRRPRHALPAGLPDTRAHLLRKRLTLKLLVDDRVDLGHKVVGGGLVELLVLEGNLVEAHDFKRQVGYGLEQVLAECVSELSLCCLLHTDHFVGLIDLLLEDFDDAAVF